MCTQICRKLATEQWTIVQDPEYRMGPYAYSGNQWVGFDDVRTVKQKVCGITFYRFVDNVLYPAVS